MKKWRCKVCGEIVVGEHAPEKCPLCKAPAEKFEEVVETQQTWAAEHVVGVAKGVSQEIIDGLRANFEGECSEVGMYLAMARVAHREGYPEIGLLLLQIFLLVLCKVGKLLVLFHFQRFDHILSISIFS